MYKVSQELQSVKPGIIFNKVSATILWQLTVIKESVKFHKISEILWQTMTVGRILNLCSRQKLCSFADHFAACNFEASWSDFTVFNFSAYADEAHINPVALGETPWLLQIEWTAKSETPITIFRVQFMVRQGKGKIIIRNWIACYN